MLITFSSLIPARFQTRSPEIMASGNFASRPDPNKSLTARNFLSRRESRQDSHRDFGHRESGYPPRITPTLPPGSCRDFGRRESGYPPRIPARFPPGSCRDFGRRESRLPPRIQARFPPGSCRDFGRRESRFPPRIPVRIPAGTGNPGGQNLGGIPAGFLPGSWQDPAKIPVPFLQGWQASYW